MVMIFICERAIGELDGGIRWEPWYLRKGTFREVLRLSYGDSAKDTYRFHRVKTQAEFDQYEEGGMKLFGQNETWDCEVEWV